MACDSPYFVKRSRASVDKIPVPCGRCPECKRRRVNEWVFRLMQEERVSLTSYFITLTYDTRYVPISDNGFLTLRKSDLQKYWKRLRKLCPSSSIKYYACGEYGTKNKRPHYHAIVFNVPDQQLIFDAWHLDGDPIGQVVVGTVTTDSVAYVMKYIDKSDWHRLHGRDDRVPEFSLMSKGLGDSYLSDSVKAYHRSHIDELYVTKLSGHKCPMPRYYRNRIFTESEREQQIGIVQGAVARNEDYDRHVWRIQFSDRMTYEQYVESKKYGRHSRYYSQIKNRNL